MMGPSNQFLSPPSLPAAGRHRASHEAYISWSFLQKQESISFLIHYLDSRFHGNDRTIIIHPMRFAFKIYGLNNFSSRWELMK
jgi:hypothetical protein